MHNGELEKNTKFHL